MSLQVLCHKEWIAGWNSDQQPRFILISKLFQHFLVAGLQTCPSTNFEYGQLHHNNRINFGIHKEVLHEFSFVTFQFFIHHAVLKSQSSVHCSKFSNFSHPSRSSDYFSHPSRSSDYFPKFFRLSSVTDTTTLEPGRMRQTASNYMRRHCAQWLEGAGEPSDRTHAPLPNAHENPTTSHLNGRRVRESPSTELTTLGLVEVPFEDDVIFPSLCTPVPVGVIRASLSSFVFVVKICTRTAFQICHPKKNRRPTRPTRHRGRCQEERRASHCPGETRANCARRNTSFCETVAKEVRGRRGHDEHPPSGSNLPRHDSFDFPGRGSSALLRARLRSETVGTPPATPPGRGHSGVRKRAGAALHRVVGIGPRAASEAPSSRGSPLHRSGR